MLAMPEIARFLGIVISMYHREHGVPHFHAHYGEHWISFEVDSGLIHGTFPGQTPEPSPAVGVTLWITSLKTPDTSGIS